MDIAFLICLTVVFCVVVICFAFGPNFKNKVNTNENTNYTIITEETKKEIATLVEEEKEMTNAYITALGEVNEIFGGVEDDNTN